MVSRALYAEPLSASHCTGCGARKALKRRSTQSSIRSRTISPEMPLVLAIQAIIFSVMCVDGESDAYDLGVPASNLHHIRSPALVRRRRDDRSLVPPHRPQAGVLLQQQVTSDDTHVYG